MSKILAIDPGPVQSAYVLLDYRTSHDIVPEEFGIVQNEDMIRHIGRTLVVIEKVTPYGAVVGNELFETIFWSGRFYERSHHCGVNADRIARKAVVTQICGLSQANDSRVRQALIDRWGGVAATKKGGPLYKVSKDVWAALALGVTWIETRNTRALEG